MNERGCRCFPFFFCSLALEKSQTLPELSRTPSTVMELVHAYMTEKFLLSSHSDASAGVTFLRGAWSDRDTNDIFAHCSLIFYFLDFKFSNFVCPSVLHRLIWFFLKNSFKKKKNIGKTTQNALASSIFIVLSIALKLGTPLLHTQAQNTLLQNF